MKPSWLVVTTKRLLDLSAGLLGLLAFALTWPVLALLIRLESPGPLLYSQVRVGMNRRDRRSVHRLPAGVAEDRRKGDVGGRTFSILKYRTMRVDAESNGPQLCAKGIDPRVTFVGKWLRALHIDEIPQFINVVRGDMSFIGPRPERPHFTMKFSQTLPNYSDRTSHIRPGITGLAQILLGYDDSDESVVRKSHYDMSYRASFCSLHSWLKMEWYVLVHTVGYLLQKPKFEGETRDLAGLKRARLLPFQGRALAADPSAGPAGSRETLITISFGRSARPTVLTGSNHAELAARLDAIDFEDKPSPDVFVRPKADLDLEDMGFLVHLAHKVKNRGGNLCLRSPNLTVQKMLRAIRLDSSLDLQNAPVAIRNFLTVDVECWFHAYNMRAVAPKCSWHLQPTRIVANMERLLGLMRAHDAKCTFFVLGWVADHFPEVVRMIDAEGHEIGTHGYHHDLITEMTPSQFEDDLLRSLEAISRNSSRPVRGHRASNFSVVKDTLWALEILAKHGIEYDSSIFPIARDRYGMPNHPNRHPHTLRLGNGASIKELPMSTMRVGSRRFPVAGGGYLRLYPHSVTERFIERSNVRGLPAMVYLHPWELDVLQDRHYLGVAKTFQHYVGIKNLEWKLNRLLGRFDFSSIEQGLLLPRVQSLLRRNPVDIASQHSEEYTSARTSSWNGPISRSPISVQGSQSASSSEPALAEAALVTEMAAAGTVDPAESEAMVGRQAG